MTKWVVRIVPNDSSTVERVLNELESEYPRVASLPIITAVSGERVLISWRYEE